MAIPYSDVSPFASNRMYLNGGEANYDRDLLAFGSVVPATSGDIKLTGFTALHTETCNNITAYTGATAAGATPTLCKMGVYQQDNTGKFTLLASTANDTTLFSAINTRYVRPLTVPFNKVANSFYATAVIVVTSFTAPNLIVAGNNGSAGGFVNAILQQVPSGAVRLTGQTDLPLTLTPNALSNPFFQEVMP